MWQRLNSKYPLPLIDVGGVGVGDLARIDAEGVVYRLLFYGPPSAVFRFSSLAKAKTLGEWFACRSSRNAPGWLAEFCHKSMMYDNYIAAAEAAKGGE